MKGTRNLKKWIFIREGFPFKGGSSTFFYLLFDTMRQRLPRAEYWNVVKSEDMELGRRLYGEAWENPRKLDRVRTVSMDGRNQTKKIIQLIRKVRPHAVMSKSRSITVFLKREIPGLWVEHITSTCEQIKEGIARGTLISLEDGFGQARSGKTIPNVCRDEQDAVRYADRIRFHSDSVRFWYWYFYPQYRFKMDDDIYWDYPVLKRFFQNHEKPKPWKSRTVDVLFAATDWKRPEKNFELLKTICSRLDLIKKRVVIVGLCPHELPSSLLRFPVISQEELYYLMCDSRVFVCPSRYDEAPNVIFEAGLAHCNIVCSSNCGNYRMAHSSLRAKLTAVDFVKKIRRALRHPLKGNVEDFEKRDLRDLFFPSNT